MLAVGSHRRHSLSEHGEEQGAEHSQRTTPEQRRSQQQPQLQEQGGDYEV